MFDVNNIFNKKVAPPFGGAFRTLPVNLAREGLH
jgi:hypothetical protein